jgi:hypothetical protein
MSRARSAALAYSTSSTPIGDGLLGTDPAAEHVIDQLRSVGTFADGQYVDTDPATGRTRTRDAVQAIYDTPTGGQFAVPQAGNEAPVLVHARAFH